jgi:UDP-N-acetylglucosamine acyltransferase
MTQIHPSAVVSGDVSLASDVEVGPYAIISAGAIIGNGCRIGAHSRIEGPVTIGDHNEFYGFASVGSPPQDLKYRGEQTALIIGNNNVFREFVTVNRGTAGGGGTTLIANDNFFMAYSHVAHDCRIGSNTIFSNNATLAGHVEIGDFAIIGAFSAIHQFCRVGEHAFIGGGSMCTLDVLPYVKTVGSRPTKTYGINSIGLQRKGFSEDTIDALQRAYRILIRSKLKLDDALMRIESDLGNYPEARYLVDFIRGSQRGFIR